MKNPPCFWYADPGPYAAPQLYAAGRPSHKAGHLPLLRRRRCHRYPGL